MTFTTSSLLDGLTTATQKGFQRLRGSGGGTGTTTARGRGGDNGTTWMVVVVAAAGLLGCCCGTAAYFITTTRSRRLRQDDAAPVEAATESASSKKATKELNYKVIGKQRFLPKLVPPDIDVIVIGSGMAGLTVAVTLAKDQGWAVLVLEQSGKAGGNLHCFGLQGYQFDTGLHYVGAGVGDRSSSNSQGAKLMNYLTDGNVEWASMGDTFDLAVIRDMNNNHNTKIDELAVSSNRNDFKKELQARFPSHRLAIDAYFSNLRNFKRYFPMFFLWKWLPRPLQTITAPIFRRLLHPCFGRTAAEVMNDLGITNQKLQGMLSYHWGDTGEPAGKAAFAIHAATLDHYVHGGAYYPVGGPTVIPVHMIHTIEAAGGKVLTKIPVQEILVSPTTGKAIGVRVKGGHEILAKRAVVSTAGAANTYLKLIPEQHRARIQPQLKALQNMKAGNVEPTFSMCMLFVGIKGTAEELQLPKHNVWVYPSWNHDENCRLFLQDPLHNPFPIVFISFASAKDPLHQERFGPERQTATVITTMPYDVFEKYKDLPCSKRGAEYEELKKPLADRLLQVLLQEFPLLQDRIEVAELGTPVTLDHYLGNYRGMMYGLAQTPERFLETSDWLSVQTPIANLYLSGQDTLTNGIFGAALSGLFTCSVMDRTFLFRNAHLFL